MTIVKFFTHIAPEPPVRIHASSSTRDVISLNGQGQLVLPNLWRGKRSFKQYQNKFDSVKEVGEKDKELCNVEPKICMKVLFHYSPALLI